MSTTKPVSTMSHAEIKVPTLGESVTEATIAKWLKQEGEAVSADEPVVELETDKVTLEVNAPSAGVLAKISVAEGENVEVGALLGTIDADASATTNAEAKPANDAPAGAKDTNRQKDTPAPQPDTAAPLSPSVQKLVSENNVSTQSIQGTGKNGRLTKGDVLAHLDSKPQQQTTLPSATPVSRQTVQQNDMPEERVKMTRLRQRIAQRLKDAQNTAAMLTTFNEVDMSAVMELRKTYKDHFIKAHDVKLGFMSFFVKAAVAALKKYPAVNAEIDGTDIVYKNYYHVSVAVSTESGLVVPVITNCDQKSFADIEAAIVDVGTRARDGQLKMDELTGGTFTITNGGIFGSLLSTPILNPPQSAILGMHSIQQRPVVVNGEIQIRPMMYLALSYDHRIIDGKEAVSFLVAIKEAIEDPQRLLIGV